MRLRAISRVQSKRFTSIQEEIRNSIQERNFGQGESWETKSLLNINIQLKLYLDLDMIASDALC